MLKICGIDSYDDLLLPGHRLLAQLPVFASGEHIKNVIRASTAEIERVCTSIVYFPIVISYLSILTLEFA